MRQKEHLRENASTPLRPANPQRFAGQFADFFNLAVQLAETFAALFTEFTVHPPIWVHLVLWLPLTLIVCLGLLRPFKGAMLAAQFMNKASEARND